MTNDFNQLIAQQTGIIIRKEEQKYLDKIVATRCQHLKFSNPDFYWNLLNRGGQESKQEWQTFISLITNNESYFFRDEEQFRIVQDVILPELIDRHRDDRTLRICSAGCSTGQEPYSLAIALQELLPEFQDWQITILGIDIDESALEVARKGIYESWSFRGVKATIKDKYFQKVNRQYHLRSNIKNMVDFQPVNLFKTHFPQLNGDLRDFDLIICRNVFIYFDRAAIELALNKFYQSLKPSGYLIVGHTELHGHKLDRFKIKVFDHSLVYQRPTQAEELDIIGGNNIIESIEHSTPLQINHTIPQISSIDTISNNPPSETDSFTNVLAERNSLEKDKEFGNSIEQTLIAIRQNLESRQNGYISSGSTDKTIVLKLILKKVEILREKQLHQQAIVELENILPEYLDRIDIYYLLAEIYADLGNYNSAQNYCQKALAIDKLSIKINYLLAQIEQARDNNNEAKQIFKKIIYLEPSFIPAYLNLSQIYRQEKDNRRSSKMQEAAISILRKLPSGSIIPEMGGLTAAKAIEVLQQ